MRAEQGDQVSGPLARSRFPVVHLVIVVLLAVAVVGYWWWSGQDTSPSPPPKAAGETALIVPAAPPPTPDIPRVTPPPPPAPAAADTPAPVPPPEPELPDVEEADAWLMAQLDDLGIGPSLLGLYDSAHPLSVSAAVLDGLSRGNLLRKMIPGWSPAGPFATRELGDDVYLDPAGYARFDTIVSALVALEPATLELGFHRLRPLYEQTYGELGLDPEDVDNALIRVLDQVIAAPVLDDPPRLLQDSVMYTYADPDLEALSAVQKQLLRMGPDNTRRLQRHAERVRAELLSID